LVEYAIEAGPAFSVLRVRLRRGESLTVESGAYMMSKGRVEVSTSAGGLLKGLLRRVAGGEPVFLNRITAVDDAEVWVAPPVAGDIVAVDLSGGSLYVQDSSYLAHVGDIDVGVAWRGVSGLIAEGELLWVKVSGTGTVFLNSYGAIIEVELGPGEEATIDNSHFVALEGSVKWRIRKFGGWKTFFLGGEGLVVDVEGPGRVWLQTRNLPALAGVLSKFLPTKR